MADSETLDPQAAQQLAAATEHHARSQLDPDSRTIYIVWVACWAVAMFSGYLNARDVSPFDKIGWPIYFAALAIGVIYSSIESSRASRGISGRSKTEGDYVSIAYLVGWAAFGLVVFGVGNITSGADHDAIMATVPPVLATLLIGAVYQLGGAYWPRSHMRIVGLLLSVVAGVAALFGPVDHYLVLAIGGAASFGIGAVAVTRAS